MKNSAGKWAAIVMLAVGACSDNRAEPSTEPSENTGTPVGSTDTLGIPDDPVIYRVGQRYTNISEQAVPAFGGPNPTTAFKGQVGAMDEVTVVECAPASTFCLVEWGGEGARGWVDMQRLTRPRTD